MPRAQELGKLLALVGILLELEDALEGSFLRYGLGDLGDLYRDRLTLRQLWVRIQACPEDSPLWLAWRSAQERAEAERKVAEVEDTLSIFTKPKEG